MRAKLLEIRDRATFIVVVAIDMNPDAMTGTMQSVERYDAQKYLLRRHGYPCDGKPNIAIARAAANGDRFSNDPYYWRGRTYPVAHNYIIEHWAALRDGDVVDVEFILGETTTKKISERFEV